MEDSVKDFPLYIFLLGAKLGPYDNFINLYIVKVFLISYFNFLLQEEARCYLPC
jgi:hypothetical protein